MVIIFGYTPIMLGNAHTAIAPMLDTLVSIDEKD